MKYGRTTMHLHLRHLLLLLTVTWLIIGRCIATNTSSATNEESIREVLAKFERGDPGWRVRMESLTQAVRAGADAIPVLTESLDTSVAPVREFAAHALSMI